MPAAADLPPILWLRIDRGCEWLCDVRVLQPQHMWVNQLKLSRDVVAQLEAVEVSVFGVACT